MAKKKKIIVWIVIIAVVVGGLVLYFSSRKQEVEYTTEEVKKGDLAQTVSVTGEIIPENQSDLSFQVGGEISQIYVDVGDKVEKGQRLVQIKAGTLPAELEQAEKALEAQKQTYKDIKEKDDTYSDEQRRSQRATVEQYEAAIQKVKVNLYRTVLYSPIDGIISQRSVDLGEIIAVTDVVLTIIGEGGLELQADVPESDIVKVAVGQKATITLDAFSSDEEFEAEVVEIEPASTVIQDVVYYRVKLKFDGSDERIKPGMSADVDIKTDERNNVLMIPSRAVKTEGDQEYVEILKDGNLTEKINVKTGLKGDDGLIEITSGLKSGEKVITLSKNGK